MQLATRLQLPNLEIETDSMVMIQSLATPCEETQQLSALLNDWQVPIAAGRSEPLQVPIPAAKRAKSDGGKP